MSLIYQVLRSEGASHLDALNIASRIEEALADAGFEISAKGLKLKSGRILTLEDIERLAAEAEEGYDMENAIPVSVMVPLGQSEPEWGPGEGYEQCGDVSPHGKVCVRAKGHTGVHKGPIEDGLVSNTCSACGKRFVDCECDFKAGHLTKS